MNRALLLLILTATVACGDNQLNLVDASSDNGNIDAAVVHDAPVPVDATPDPDAGLTLACSLTELQPLFTCAQTSCSMTPTPACFTTSCGLLLLTLSPSCRTCVLTALVSGDPMATAAACGLGAP
jgi:hypothetical protein